MLRKVLAAFIAIFALNSIAVAQVINCQSVLQDSLVDRRSSAVSEILISSMKNDICSRDFDTYEEAKSYMRSGGWDLEVFELFDNSLKDNKSTNASVYRVSDSQFCSSSASDLAQSFGANYLEINGRFVLEAYNQCIRDTGIDKTFIAFELIGSGDDQVIDAALYRVIGGNDTTSLSYELESFSVVPSDAGVECQFQGQAVPEELTFPVTINATPARIACAKTEDRNVSILISTSEGDFSIPMQSMPDSEILTQNATLSVALQQAESELSEVQGELNAVQGRLSDAESRASSAIAERDARAAEVGRLQNRINGVTLFSVYNGDGSGLRGGNIFAQAPGVALSANPNHAATTQYMENICKVRDMRYLGWIFTGDVSGGCCGHNWFAVACIP